MQHNFFANRRIRAPFAVAILIVLLGAGDFYIYGRMNSHVASGPPAQVATSTVQSGATTTAVVDDNTPPSITPPSVSVPPPKPPAAIGHEVGFAEGDALTSLSAANLNTDLDQMAATGATWVRVDIEWGNVQYTSPDTSTWGAYDRVINAIVAHHLNVLGIIAYTPQWARAPGCDGGADCPPKDPQQFATFAGEVAARYKADGAHYWEIWNEPNDFDFWATKADCDAYTAVLKAAYPAIKSADPDAVVITGGLSDEDTDDVNISPTDFLSCIYKDGGKNYFDAVADHPYTFPQYPTDPTSAWAEMSQTSPSLRSIMVANGDSAKKIWITEFGAPTNGPDKNWYVSEAGQAQMLTDAFGLYKTYSWAGPIFLYTFKDDGTSTNTNENFFGILRADGSQKPAYTTLKNSIASGL